MNWRYKLVGTAVVLALAAPSVAFAQVGNIFNELYVGAGGGRAKDADLGGDNTDTAWKAFVGWDINKIFGLEAGYVHLGTFKGAPGQSVSAKGWNVDARAGVPFYNDRASVFVKGGGFRGSVDSTAMGSTHKWDWTYGAGAEYDFTHNFGARAEWERYRLKDVGFGTNDHNVNLWSASLVWKLGSR